MSQKIKGNTVLFMSIIVFIKLFELVFTPTNSIVGVTVIIAILVLMSENLTKNPIKNFSILLAINLGQGISTYVANQNIWLGLILNFLALASVGYVFSFKMNKIMVAPFGLQYLFILYSPVEGSELRIRLLALGAGAVIIMVTQFIIHRKNKERETGDKLIDFRNNIQKGEGFRVREAYALRIGLVTAISAFMVAFFEINQGRWIVYTVFALTELYSEHCKLRSRQRLEGTIVGVLVVFVLFFFIKSPTLRTALILAGGYLDTYTTNYRDKMICATVSVIASISLTSGTMAMGVSRIVYVMIGVALALIGDALVFRKELAEVGAI